MWKIIKIFGGQKKSREMLWWSDAIEMPFEKKKKSWMSYSNPKACINAVLIEKP
jgi:hypothetical protein